MCVCILTECIDRNRVPFAVDMRGNGVPSLLSPWVRRARTSTASLYNHCTMAENPMKYMPPPPDSFIGIQILQHSYSPVLCPGPRWGSLRRSPGLPSRLGSGFSSPFPFAVIPSASESRYLRRPRSEPAPSVPRLLSVGTGHWSESDM